MNCISYFRSARRSLNRRLMGYMATLVVFLIVVLCVSLFLSGRLTSPKTETAAALTAQMEFFRGDMRSLWRNVSVKGVKLSEEMTTLLERSLSEQAISFDQLNENLNAIREVEDALLEPLCQYVRQADCSDAFVILDVRGTADGPEDQRAGLYVQKNNAEKLTNDLLLFRGLAGVGKAHGVMPHRKWAREFATDSFPDYGKRTEEAALPLSDACRSSDLLALPETSDRAIFLTVPMIGSDGTVYGLCGFAVSQTYFSGQHEQPSNLRNLACVLTSGSFEGLDAGAGLTTYTDNGFFPVPEAVLTEKSMGSGLSVFSGGGFSYVGMTELFTIANGDASPHTLAVLIPREVYISAAAKNIAQIVLLAVLLCAFSLSCCLFASRRYIVPVREDIARLDKPGRGKGQMNFPEFEPISGSLHAGDMAHTTQVFALETENLKLQSHYLETQSLLEQAQADTKQLAERRKEELDPADYEAFLIEYEKMSPLYKTVLDSMVDKVSAQQLAEQLGKTKGTIYSYRRDVYDMLKIHGPDQLHQLRLRVTLMRREQAEKEKQEQ